jgi:hypothetical protein
MNNLANARNFIPLQSGSSKTTIDLSTLQILSPYTQGLIYSAHFNSTHVNIKFINQRDPLIDELRVDMAKNLLFQNLGWTQMNVSFQNNTGNELLIKFYKDDNFYLKNVDYNNVSNENYELKIKNGNIAFVTLYAFRSMSLLSSYILVEPMGFITPPAPQP